MSKNTRDEVLKRLKEVTDKAIIEGEISLGFYEDKENIKVLSEDSQKRNGIKVLQIRDNIKFNKKFLEYLNTL